VPATRPAKRVAAPEPRAETLGVEMRWEAEERGVGRWEARGRSHCRRHSSHFYREHCSIPGEAATGTLESGP
jgi:hypothetical protein